MKKSLIALAALAVVTAASAQSTVTLSGAVSMGLQQTGATVAAQTNQVAGSDTSSVNLFQFTASEDLGGGMTATAVIQNRLSALNTDLVTGDIYVQLSGGFGVIRAGKYTFNSNSSNNAFASRTITTLAGAGQALGTNNTLQYTTPSFNGLTATLAYQPNNVATGSNGTGMKVNYAAGPLAVQLSTSRAGQLEITGGTARVNTLGASYDLGVAKIFVNTFDQTAGATISNSTGAAYTGNTTALLDNTGTSFSIAVPMGAATLKAGIIDRTVATGVATDIDKTSIGVDYALSKRTMLIAEHACQ